MIVWMTQLSLSLALKRPSVLFLFGGEDNYFEMSEQPPNDLHGCINSKQLDMFSASQKHHHQGRQSTQQINRIRDRRMSRWSVPKHTRSA